MGAVVEEEEKEREVMRCATLDDEMI